MDPAQLEKIVSLIDLTSLNDNDTEQTISQLCSHARNALGKVAAICVYPKFVPLVKALIDGQGINIATVCNFPAGDGDIAACQADIINAIEQGADEIDVVLPYQHYLDGKKDYVFTFLNDCHRSCGDKHLKVILETGALMSKHNILDAAAIAIECGANFIKTSTGKLNPGATPEAVEAILEAILIQPNKHVGIKISGGVKTIADAQKYLQQIEHVMGHDWVHPDNVRIGASSLLTTILSNQ